METAAAGLEIAIRPGIAPARQEELCRLAARLGYRAVWLHADRPPVLAQLARLVDAAAPAQVGLVLGATGPHLAWLAGTRGSSCAGQVLLDADPADRPEDLAAAVGSPDAYAKRVHARRYDLAAAGYVVHSRDRAETAELLRAARRRGTPHGLRLTADLPVVFGRTRGEAEARLRRDAWLDRTRDPRRAGLFGTFAEAQLQVVDLVRAGADNLRATLADEADVADLLAQLRAVTVGPVAALLKSS
jgi:hypothetical protein